MISMKDLEVRLARVEDTAQRALAPRLAVLELLLGETLRRLLLESGDPVGELAAIEAKVECHLRTGVMPAPLEESLEALTHALESAQLR